MGSGQLYLFPSKSKQQVIQWFDSDSGNLEDIVMQLRESEINVNFNNSLYPGVDRLANYQVPLIVINLFSSITSFSNGAGSCLLNTTLPPDVLRLLGNEDYDKNQEAYHLKIALQAIEKLRSPLSSNCDTSILAYSYGDKSRYFDPVSNEQFDLSIRAKHVGASDYFPIIGRETELVSKIRGYFQK